VQESDTEDCALPISDFRVFAGTFNINGAVLDADDAALWLNKVRSRALSLSLSLSPELPTENAVQRSAAQRCVDCFGTAR
jgi:hypothetical protein